jgi:nitroreductase
VRRNLDFDRPLERSLLLECIDVATQAPTGIGGENWRFLIVQDAKPKAALAELYSQILNNLATERDMDLKPTHKALMARLHEIPAMIFVLTDGPPPLDQVSTQVAYYGSILPAAWSLMLALRARRIGTTWTTLLSSRQEEVGEILGIPSDITQTVMMPAAHMKGARLKPAARLPADQVTYWNRWQED